MYKLLIVDDEKTVRDGLKQMIDWEDYGIMLCAEAANGTEALTIVESESPHIIITDIQMPDMDGLEFMQKLKEQESDCKVIVLSGYNEYSLVRRAMRLGAIDYLLKPPSRDDILQIVEEVRKHIESDMNAKLQNTQGLRLLKTNVLNRLVNNEISPIELRSKVEILEMTLPKGACRIVMLTFGRGEENSKQNVKRTLQMYEQCEQQLDKGTMGNSLAFVSTVGRVCLLVDDDSLEGDQFEELAQLRELLMDTMQMTIVMSVGCRAKTYRSIAHSFETATEAAEYQVVFGKDRMLIYEEVSQIQKYADAQLSLSEEEIQTQLLQRDYENTEKYIVSLFRRYEEARTVDKYMYRYLIMQLILLCCRCGQSEKLIDMLAIAELKERALSCLSEQHEMEQFRQLTLWFVKEFIDIMMASGQKTYNRLVADMIQRVKEDYSNQNLSLQYLADSYHRNVAYIGRLFKKEVGCSFNDYLNAIRIEQAKELLLNTQYKGEELCRNVGFANYNYFYIVFKKLTGVNPMDYRK